MKDTTKKLLRILTLCLVFVAVIAIDLATKYYICNITATGERIYFIKGVLEFTYSENTGASFGIMGENTTLLTIFSCISAAVIIGYLIFAKNSHFLLQLSLTMFASGAIGNIYDRIKFGYVRDFIDYALTKTLFKFEFAICNFADAVLVIACIMLIIYVLFFYSKHYDKTHPKTETAGSEDSLTKAEDNKHECVEEPLQDETKQDVISENTPNIDENSEEDKSE